MRDLRAIGNKIVQVLHPSSENAVLRDWDLWGPLIVRSGFAGDVIQRRSRLDQLV